MNVATVGMVTGDEGTASMSNRSVLASSCAVNLWLKHGRRFQLTCQFPLTGFKKNHSLLAVQATPLFPPTAARRFKVAP